MMDYATFIFEELRSPKSRELMSLPNETQRKNESMAEKSRKLGEDMFRLPKHDEEIHRKILRCYADSLLLAPNNSKELGLAYNSKSALLLHLRKYEACIEDIDQALKLDTITPSLRIELLCRKIECLVALGKKEEKTEILDEAKKCLGLLEQNYDNRAELEMMIERAERRIEADPEIDESNDNKIEHLEVRNLKESKGIVDCIRMAIDGRYFCHLKTRRTNLRPGELICISKPYVMVTRHEEKLVCCAHCTKFLWSSVPCPNCSFSLYCSEKCKDEALSSYHDIECQIPENIIAQNSRDAYVDLALRTVIKGLKEKGSFQALRLLAEDGTFPLYPNNNNRGRHNDGRFDFSESFRCIFAFTNINVPSNKLTCLVSAACRTLIALARFTSFFGEEFRSLQELQLNNNVIFIGTLLLYISLIAYRNSDKIAEFTTIIQNGKIKASCSSNAPCRVRGYYLDSFESLLPHSCNPNVKSVHIEGGKILWYALQPIQINDILFSCPTDTFFEMNKIDRVVLNSLVLNHNCSCVPCTNNWPNNLFVYRYRLLNFEDILKIVIEGMTKEGINGNLQITIGENEEYTQTTINNLSAIMSSAFEVLNQPSKILCAMICVLRFVFDRLHGIKHSIPSECRIVPV